MIYTCYEMIQDCRADKAEGWRHFVSCYVPVMRKLADHYDSGRAGAVVDHMLTTLRQPGSTLFESLDPSPERWFVAQLRQLLVAELPAPEPEIAIGLEEVAAALEPLTVVQKLSAWIETMNYDAAQTGAMLRMAPNTVEKIRAQAADLIRGKVDAWRQTLLTENGRKLGAEAASASTKDCLPPRVFLDVLDGRATWSGREEMERHVGSCWHCIDHFGRMAEVIEVLRGIVPLEETDAAPLLELMGIHKQKAPLWKRLAGRG